MITNENKGKRFTKVAVLIALKLALVFIKNDEVKNIIREIIESIDDILFIINDK